MIETHLNNQNNPYLYNGKELDAETGFYYYGARYYEPKSSLWLSVDPLAEKMPDFSAYAYAFNNPVMFVDPTGMQGEEVDWHPDKNGNLVADAGDNAKTLAEYQGISYDQAVKQLSDNGYTTNDKGILNLNVGDAVNTGSFNLPEVVLNATVGDNAFSHGTLATFIGDGLSIGQHYQYNDDFWLGRDFKFRSTSVNGNQWTGGKHKYAKALAKDLGRLGTILNFYSIAATRQDYKNGEISKNRMYQDQTVNGIGFLGPYGAAFNLGWNLGYLIEDISGTNIQINWQHIREGRSTDRWFDDPKKQHSIFSDEFLKPKR